MHALARSFLFALAFFLFLYGKKMDSPRELEWYLRDHLFRQTGKGRTQFAKSALAGEMVQLYLRYRQYDPVQLAQSLSPVVDDLVSMNVLVQTGEDPDVLELAGGGPLVRMQCAKCFYVSYLVPSEPRLCQRCSGQGLRDFPPPAKKDGGGKR
ncbi:MAG: hypothetical protein C4292_00755 [Nitrososphaera sp.]